MSNLAPLHDHLLAYANADHPDERSRIEAEVWQQHGQKGAVFVLDMSGFSRTTQRHGIVYYLAMVHRMQLIVEPIIEHYQGRIIKFEADNCFAWFPEVGKTIDAAIGINLAVEATNRTTPEDVEIAVACGIDYGEFLLLEHEDFFGNPVNQASKLGEDIAGAGEILVTREAMAQVEGERKFKAEEVEFTVSGISISAFRILY